MSEQSLARAVLAWMEVPLDQDGGTFPELEALARASLFTPPADDVREALTSVEELEALPTRSVVMDGSGEVWRKTVTGLWDCLDGQGDQPVEESSTVLWQSAPPRVAVLWPAGEIRPRGTVTPTVDEWSERMDTERARQIEHGYDDAHDAQHGAAHLLNWAIDYARRGNNLAAATMVRCALRLPHGTITETETPERLAERYVSAFVGDRPDDSSTIVYRGPLLEMVANAVREARS